MHYLSQIDSGSDDFDQYVRQKCAIECIKTIVCMMFDAVRKRFQNFKNSILLIQIWCCVA